MRCYDGEAANASEQVYDLCHFSQQRLSPNLHPAKSEPFLPQVFQRGADMIHCVVDAKEAVVGCRVKYWK